MPQHSEHAFETAIEHGLTSQGGYTKRAPDAYSEEMALFPADVCEFLKDSQAGKWQSLEALLGERTEATVAENFSEKAR